MMGIPDEVYTVILDKFSSIYVGHIEGKWKHGEKTHYPIQRPAISSKVIATGNTLDFVLLKVKQYLDYIIKREKKYDSIC